MVFVSEVNKITMHSRTEEIEMQQKCGLVLCGLLVTAEEESTNIKIWIC